MLNETDRRTTRVAAGAAVALLAALAFPLPASAAAMQDASTTRYQSVTTTTEDVALEGCDPSAASQAGLCDGIEIVTEQRFTLGTDQATKAADELGMNRAETSSFVAKAAAGAVQGATWTHSYWAGTVKEVHAGTTYWDGSYAWVGTYRGLTGEHTCGKPGSYAVGATVSDRKCPKPGASSKADSVETFNLALATPIPANFTVGLHNAYTKGGVRSTWQVGG